MTVLAWLAAALVFGFVVTAIERQRGDAEHIFPDWMVWVGLIGWLVFFILELDLLG